MENNWVYTVVIAAFFGLILMTAQHPVHSPSGKIDGVSYVAPPHPTGKKAMISVKKVNANWVALTPYAFSKEGSPEVRFDMSRQWWGERKKGLIATIKHAQALGLHVMLKPHVWIHGQGWTGNFELHSEAQWQKWQKNYQRYIVTYAKIADSLGVNLICIGTEFKKAADERPDFWRHLIRKIRSFYHGKLTYAANWDNYRKIKFWDALDYIGVDAYFPLSKNKMPATTNLETKWKPVRERLKKFSSQQHKPILFTEFGYRSVNYTTDAHWKYKRGERAVNMQAQARAYKALFETFWHEPWFAGGFVWKWFDHPRRWHHRHHAKNGYTPQGKPAEQILRHWYGGG